MILIQFHHESQGRQSYLVPQQNEMHQGNPLDLEDEQLEDVHDCGHCPPGK